MTKKRPAWWPENPYPEDIFPMPREEYSKVIPDANLRGAVAGMLGRVIWDIASDMIFDAMYQAQEEAKENDCR